jgi:hypothetical protein
MRFQVSRSSSGVLSEHPPCRGAVRGPESAAWPGQYPWFLDLDTLDDLVAFLDANGGAVGLFAPEEGEEHVVLEIYDDTDDD